MNITLKTNKIPETLDAVKLYLDAGWGEASDYKSANSVLKTAFQNSHFITAYDGEHLVGMIRFLTDGAHDTQIIECLVEKSYQNKDIATNMISKLIENHGHTSIYVESVEQNKDFFIKNNFKKHSLVGLSRKKQQG